MQIQMSYPGYSSIFKTFSVTDFLSLALGRVMRQGNAPNSADFMCMVFQVLG